MQKIYRKILELKESQMRDTVWYSLGTVCGSASSMIILLIVTRIMGQEISGKFSLAWSAAQLMLTIGWFNTRQYQVSDVSGENSYYEYLMAKFLSSFIMVIVGFIYVKIFNYDKMTQEITLALCVLMISEVFADFFCGFFQCNNKLHIGGRSYVVRNLGYLAIFSVTLYIWKNMILSVVSAIVFVATWLIVFDYQLVKRIPKQNNLIRVKNILNIFVDCFPLFVGLFITSFITNIPKNAINAYMHNREQASYNILFMPTAVINMFNMFICVPYYTKLALMWNEGKRREFFSILYKIVGVVAVITVTVVFGGGILGIPVLSWLYGVDLYSYRVAFVILIFGGGFNGLISILTYVITVFRKQRIVVYIYIVSAICAQLVSGTLVIKCGLTGASLTYVLAMVLICIGLTGYIMFHVRRSDKKGEKE